MKTPNQKLKKKEKKKLFFFSICIGNIRMASNKKVSPKDVSPKTKLSLTKSVDKKKNGRMVPKRIIES